MPRRAREKPHRPVGSFVFMPAVSAGVRADVRLNWLG
jgi:hypothetical protein